MILVLAVYICGPHQDQIFWQCRCRRNMKSTGGMGSLLLSPTSFWVGLTGPHAERNMCTSSNLHFRKTSLEQESPLCQYDLVSENSSDISMFWSKTSVWTPAFISVGIPARGIELWQTSGMSILISLSSLAEIQSWPGSASLHSFCLPGCFAPPRALPCWLRWLSWAAVVTCCKLSCWIGTICSITLHVVHVRGPVYCSRGARGSAWEDKTE